MLPDFDEKDVALGRIVRQREFKQPDNGSMHVALLRHAITLLEAILNKNPTTTNPTPVNVQVQPRSNKRVDCDIERNEKGQAVRMTFTEYNID